MSDTDDDVKIRPRGEWHMSMDGTTETRVNFGRSADGHHFQIERSRFGGDTEPGWSRAYSTSDAAERAASHRYFGTNPDREPSDRERFREQVEQALEQRGPSPSAAIAGTLENAAYHRQIGQREEARTDIADARQYRLTQHDSVRVAEHRPTRRYDPDQEKIRVVLGRSAEGHHFRIEGPRNEVSLAPWSPSFDTRSDATREAYKQAYHAPESHRNKPETAREKPPSEAPRGSNDDDALWSRPYRSSAAAKRAGNDREAGTSPDRDPSPREELRDRAAQRQGPSSAAATAEALTWAARSRRNGDTAKARAILAEARTSRLEGEGPAVLRTTAPDKPKGAPRPDGSRPAESIRAGSAPADRAEAGTRYWETHGQGRPGGYRHADTTQRPSRSTIGGGDEVPDAARHRGRTIGGWNGRPGTSRPKRGRLLAARGANRSGRCPPCRRQCPGANRGSTAR